MDGTRAGIETVNDCFNLCGETEIIQRRYQHDHIAVHQLLNQFGLNGILLHTGPVHTAGVAAPAGMDVFKSRVETEHFMPVGLSPFNKLIR